MRKRKIETDSKGSKNIYTSKFLNVSVENKEYFFEIGSELTNDIAEAVAILMSRVDWNSSVWELQIKDIITENIAPEKALYWLTGGNSEWRNLEHYKKPWSEYYLDFQEEFGIIIINSIKKSNSLKDIRNNFSKYLNLPVLYDFAISKDMIR